MAKLLGLVVPERQKPARDAFSIRPRKVEQWLESLPKANLGETARQVYKVLIETNQLAFPHQERTRFLESLRDTVQYITDAMRKHFLGVTYPLPEKNQKIAAAAREILAAMATGYKIAIEDLVSSNVLFQDKKQLALLLHRAMTYTGRTLLTSYQVYAPYPPGSWAELHKLYAYAESRKLQRHKVADYQHMYEEKTTITDEYLRHLLLWLTSPYRLRQGEVTKIYNALDRMARYCDLAPPTHPLHLDYDGQFGVRLNRDKPPVPIRHAHHKCEPQTCRIIKTDRLAEHLRQDIQESEDVVTTTLTGIDMGRPDLSHDLLRRLLLAWGIESKREFRRNDKQEEVQVAVGLSAIHHYLIQHSQQNRTNPDDPFAQRAHFQSSMVQNLSDEKPDVWNMVYPDSKDINLTNIVSEELTLAGEKRPSWPVSPVETEAKLQQNAARDEPMHDWLITNESASGYCLEYTAGSDTKAQVGELVGIRRRISKRAWKWGIGVIRWMKFNNRRELQLGIEMLNPDAAAIGLRTAARDQDYKYQRTLLLPEIPAINQPASLLTGPVPWRVGNKVVLNILGKDVRVELTRLMQNTGLFAQFQFEFLDRDKSTDTPDQDDWLGEQDFGQVWSSI